MSRGDDTGRNAEIPWRITALLLVRPRTVAELGQLTEASEEAVRRHLRLALDEGVVKREVGGRAARGGWAADVWSWTGGRN